MPLSMILFSENAFHFLFEAYAKSLRDFLRSRRLCIFPTSLERGLNLVTI